MDSRGMICRHGWDTMREKFEGVVSLVLCSLEIVNLFEINEKKTIKNVDDWVSRRYICWFLYVFRTALPLSGGLSPGVGRMPLHDVFWTNCENGATSDIKAKVESIWAKDCLLDNCACLMWLDITYYLTLLLDITTWHYYLTLQLDIITWHYYLTLLLDITTWH